MFKHIGDRGIHAIDRGGDRDRGFIYEKYLNRDKPIRFVIRLDERGLIHRGKRKNCCDMAKVLSTPHESVLIIYDEGREKIRPL